MARPAVGFVFSMPASWLPDDECYALLRSRYGPDVPIHWGPNAHMGALPLEGTIFVMASEYTTLGMIASMYLKTRQIHFSNCTEAGGDLLVRLASLVGSVDDEDAATVLYQWHPPDPEEAITPHPDVANAYVITNPHLPVENLDRNFHYFGRIKAVYTRNRTRLPDHQFAALILDKDKRDQFIVMLDAACRQAKIFWNDARYEVTDTRPLEL